jgi:hypothetical protein
MQRLPTLRTRIHNTANASTQQCLNSLRLSCAAQLKDQCILRNSTRNGNPAVEQPAPTSRCHERLQPVLDPQTLYPVCWVEYDRCDSLRFLGRVFVCVVALVTAAVVVDLSSAYPQATKSRAEDRSMVLDAVV